MCGWPGFVAQDMQMVCCVFVSKDVSYLLWERHSLLNTRIC